MSEQSPSRTDEAVLHDLVMELTRRLPPSAPTRGLPAHSTIWSHAGPATAGSVAAAPVHALGDVDNRRFDAHAAQPLDSQAKAFGAQLDVLLIEASLRLQSQVTTLHPAADPASAGPVARIGAHWKSSASFAAAQGIASVDAAVRFQHAQADRAFQDGVARPQGYGPTIDLSPAPIAHQATERRKFGRVASAKARVGLVGGAVLLAGLSYWGLQGPRDAAGSREELSSFREADSKAVPSAARSSTIPKGLSAEHAVTPGVIRVEPPRDPLPQASTVTAAPLVVLNPHDGTASTDGPQDAAASLRPPVDPPLGGQTSNAPSEASSPLSLGETAPTAPPAVSRVDGAAPEAESSAEPDEPKVARSADTPLPRRKPPAPAHEEAPTVSQAASSSAGTQVAAVMPPATGLRASAAEPNAAGPKMSSDRFAPALITLKDASSVLQVFISLQKRHAVLSDKVPEVRPVPGEGQTTWYRLLVGPSVTRKEAEDICRQLGPEGQTLGCTVAVY